jgi:polysaccharide export outer membrane protein
MTAMRPLSTRRLGFAWAALLTLAAVGCSTLPAPAPPVVYEEYRVGAPDQLQVQILPDPIIQDTVIVRPDGKITVQLIGDVQAGGRTPKEIAQEVEKRVQRFKRGANVTVSIVEAASSTITVLGEVNRPGTFQLSKQTRVAEALGTSSGTTAFANLDSISVVRGSGADVQVIAVNLDAIRAGDLSSNVLVYGGDIIYVPPTTMAKIGYTIQAMLFPLQPLLGVATSVGGSAIAGGF